LKILILVANSNAYPSNLIVPFLKNTWGKDKRIDVIYYQGGENKVTFNNNVLKLNVPSSAENVNEKGLKAFEWIVENKDFDVMFRCTTTTYLNIDKLIEFVEGKEMENLFSGPVDFYPPWDVPDNEKITFVSGAGCFFSKDVVKKLIQNKDKYDFTLNDDVAISKLLVNDLGVPITEGFRQDFYYGYPFLKDIEYENYHFRFKLSTNFYPRYLEIITLLSIHLRKKIKDNKILLTIVLIIDILLFLIYKLLKLLNYEFIKYNSKLLFYKLKKQIFIMIKRIPFLYKASKSLKNRY
jgi:hypothetical protein